MDFDLCLIVVVILIGFDMVVDCVCVYDYNCVVYVLKNVDGVFYDYVME